LPIETPVFALRSTGAEGKAPCERQSVVQSLPLRLEARQRICIALDQTGSHLEIWGQTVSAGAAQKIGIWRQSIGSQDLRLTLSGCCSGVA